MYPCMVYSRLHANNKTDADLVVLGLAMLAGSSLFLFINVIISLNFGWIRKFERGLFGRLTSYLVFKDVFKTALPLAVGSLLSYAEWEILTIFAAVIG